MKEYIEKESAKNELNRIERLYRDTYMSKVRAEMVSYCCKVVEHIPAADVVEVRHGRWIDSKEDGYPSICSVCKYPVDRFYKTNYCPNCGAKMDGGADDA